VVYPMCAPKPLERLFFNSTWEISLTVFGQFRFSAILIRNNFCFTIINEFFHAYHKPLITFWWYSICEIYAWFFWSFWLLVTLTDHKAYFKQGHKWTCPYIP
jgi:hypothetical protein